MKLIAEYHTEFSSDEPFSLDWDKYGCRLQILEGSIPQGEVGTLDLYAIYSGPFQFSQDSSPVSAYYFISFSHNLQKPAILELQHCYIINNDDDAAQLTFASATASTGPPYRFRPVDGGSFLRGRYALIHQKNFSFLSIFFRRVRNSRLFHRGRVQPEITEEETETMEEDPPHSSSCSYAVLYFLIPVQSPGSWNVKLFISKYINPHFEYFKQEQERKETPVDEDWHPFVLKEGVHAVSITVLPEKEANEEELKRWNGIRRVFERNWAVIGSGTEVCMSSVLEDISSPIKIHVVWTSELPPKLCVFRIHLLGIETELSFPVIVPYMYQPGSLCPSPQEPKIESEDLPDLLRATDDVSEWFTLGIFLKVDYNKLKTLKKDYPSDLNHCRQEMLMSWISSGNATWSILVKTLRDDLKEPGLAEKIEEDYLR